MLESSSNVCSSSFFVVRSWILIFEAFLSISAVQTDALRNKLGFSRNGIKLCFVLSVPGEAII